MRKLTSVAGALICTFAAVVGAPESHAAPLCPGAAPPIRVGTIPGVLEGLTGDDRGRAYVTDLAAGRVFRLDFPGAPAQVVATVPSGGGGGLAWTPNGQLLIG